jgi:hypothetical protein
MASSTTKTGCHDVAEILLNTKNQPIKINHYSETTMVVNVTH